MDRPKKINELKNIYDMISMKGKKALVTGGAGGIGRSTASAFAELGADVALMDLKDKEDILEQNARDIKALHGVRVITVTGDVTDPASIEKILSTTVGAFGTIDILHNNAGGGTPGSSIDVTLENWQKVLALNYTSILLVGRGAANIMKDHGHGGSIVNTSSISGHIINQSGKLESNPGYTSTKAAVRHLTKAMAIDYATYGIRVNSISPGYILSGLHDGWEQSRKEYHANTVPMKRFGNLDEITGAVVFLASELSSYATGTDIIVDGGYTIW